MISTTPMTFLRDVKAATNHEKTAPEIKETFLVVIDAYLFRLIFVVF